MPEQPTNEQYSPLALIGVILAALALFGVFFISFLVAPLAVLLLFYVGFSVSDRNKSKGGGGHAAPGEGGEDGETATDRLVREAAQRRATMEKSDEEAALEAERLEEQRLEAERIAAENAEPPPPAGA